MDYQKKYLKYKTKYLNLKNQIGYGNLIGCAPPLLASIPSRIYEEKIFNMTFNDSSSSDPIYDDFISTLDRIHSMEIENKVLILKVGSSSVEDVGSVHNFRPDKNLLNSQLSRFTSEKSTYDNIFIIAIDPSTPEYSVLSGSIDITKIPPENICKFKGYFPLAPGNDKGNMIIHKLVNLNVKRLILINEMGSGCYNSFRAIISIRPDTSYFVHVNNSTAALECGNKMYAHKGTYNRCKRENETIYTKDWINLKTLTDEGDDKEPELIDEKIAKLPEESKIKITFQNNTGKSKKIDIYKEITISELFELAKQNDFMVKSMLIAGKKYFENSEIKLNEIIGKIPSKGIPIIINLQS